MTIKSKLISLAIFLIALAAINALVGLHGMKSSNAGLETVYKDRVVPLRDLKEISDAYAVNIVDTNHKVRNGNMTPAEGVKSIEYAEKLIGGKWKAYLATHLVDEEKRMVAVIEPLMAKSNAAIAKLKGLLQAGDVEGIASFAAQELYPAIDPVSEAFSKLIDVQLRVAKQEFEASEAQYGRLKLLNIAILLLGSGAGIVLSLALVNRSVVKPLAEAGKAVDAIAHGDLTQRMPEATADEIGAIIVRLSSMQSGLRDLVAGIRASVGAVGASANQLAAASSASAQASQTQSEAASSMAASIEELSVSIDQVEEHAREARNITNASGARLDESSRIIHDAASGMRGIADAVNATARSIEELETLSGQISSIVSVIREIADQTNLLALNAAIEAARAGEQGRGFAVVADEVRKLAERTTSSTQEIASMIERIQQGAQRAVTEMGSGVAQVNQGVQLAQEAGDSVSGIRSAGTQTNQAVEEISLAIREQANATRDIAKKVELIAQGAEENSAAVAQTSASAANLEHLASELEALAGKFKV